MSLLLNIHTALESASICLSSDENVIAYAENSEQQEHASWLHVAIATMLKENNFSAKDLNAVAVTIGPGSYTGLRVGLSAAKGFCYALNIPLIATGTLPLIALAAKEEANSLICPLIDARRMEVFTSLYNLELKELMAPCSMVLNPQSFEEFLVDDKILFCGNGTKKLKAILSHPNASFSDTTMTAQHLSQKSYQFYREKKFYDLAYTEPLYIKEFYSPSRKNS